MTFEERYANAYDHGYADGAKYGKVPFWGCVALVVLGMSAGVIGGFLLAHL